MKPRCITKAGLLRIERRPAVYESSVLCFSYTYLPVAVLRTDLRSVNLCMACHDFMIDTQRKIASIRETALLCMTDRDLEIDTQKQNNR